MTIWSGRWRRWTRPIGDRSDLASYYAERGETPGRWMGGGIAGIDGLDVGDVVTGEQMRLLFAEGRHPLAGQTSPDGPELLGVPFRTVEGVERPFRRSYGPATPRTRKVSACPARPGCRPRCGPGSAPTWPASGTGTLRGASRRAMWS